MRFSSDFIQKVTDTADIVSVVMERGIHLKQVGTNYKGLCPFHSEKTASFSVSPQRGFFHCFGCGVGGNVIQFVQQYDKLSFVEAVTELAERFGVPFEKDAVASAQPKSQDRILQALQLASQFYHTLLLKPLEGKPAQDYLKQRSVASEAQKTFYLGFVANEWQSVFKYLTAQGFSLENLLQAGLVKVSQKSNRPYDVFRNRVIFPIRDNRGRCIGFGGRQIDPNEPPKYLNSPESKYYHKSQTLYGFYEGKEAIRKKRHLILVEGYLDVIRLHEFGFQEAVATCGTALTAEHVQLAQRYADQVTLLLDGDQAGQEAAWRSCPLFLSSPITASVATLPAGEDPDSFLLAQGVEKFSALLGGATPIFEHLVQYSLAKHGQNVQGRSKAVKELLPMIRDIQDELIKNMALNHLAEMTHLTPSSLLEKATSTLHVTKRHATIQSFHAENSNLLENQDEKRILQALLHFRTPMNLICLAREQLQANEFSTPHFRNMYEQLLLFSNKELETIPIQEFEQHIPEWYPKIMALFMEAMPPDMEEMSADIRELEFKRWIGRIKKKNLKMQFEKKFATLQSIEEQAQASLNFRKQNAILDQFFPQR